MMHGFRGKWFYLALCLAVALTPIALAEDAPAVMADAAREKVAEGLAALREETDDYWQRALLDGMEITGATEGKPAKNGSVTVTVTVQLPALGTGLTAKSKLGDTEPAKLIGDALAYAGEKPSEYAFKVTVGDDESGGQTAQLGAADIKKFSTALAAKAKAARASFEAPALRDALVAVLAPGAGKAKLDVSKGPGAAVLTGTLLPRGLTLGDASEPALSALAATEGANAFGRDRIAAALDEANGALRAAKAKKGAAGEEFAFNVDLAAVAKDGREGCPDVLDYAKADQAEYDAVLDQLCEAVKALPDYPIQERPKTGVLNGGGKKGTRVDLKANSGDDLYVRIVEENTKELVATVFVRSGGKKTFRVPAGDYMFSFGLGKQWYGPAHAFGPEGNYLWTKQSISTSRAGRNLVWVYIFEAEKLVQYMDSGEWALQMFLAD